MIIIKEMFAIKKDECYVGECKITWTKNLVLESVKQKKMSNIDIEIVNRLSNK